MKILVTGGSGYIGSHTIIEMLEGKTYQPISIDNYSNSSAETYNRVEAITQQKVPFEKIDLTNREDLFSFLSKNPEIKGIIHFAALKAVGESVQFPNLYYRNNLLGLMNVLEAIEKFDIPYFIFSSSCSIYGNIDSLPVSEDTPVDKTLSPYAETKKMGERMIHDFYHTKPHLSAVMLRYFNPVGAHVSSLNGELPLQAPNNLVPVITRAAAKLSGAMKVFGNDYKTRDGSCVRDYIHVTDIANAHILALNYVVEQKNKTNCEVFNLGSGQGVSVLEMINTFEKVNGVKVPYELAPRREGDVEAIYSDSSKALQLLGWKPQHDLESIMKTAWNWQLKPESQVIYFLR